MNETGGNLPLDQRAADELGRGRMILLYGGSAGSARAAENPAEQERPLGHGVDFAIGADHRRLEQHAALQRLGVANRRNGDIDARA